MKFCLSVCALILDMPPAAHGKIRYVWHKQALFKGRSLVYGTTWAGWGFEDPSYTFLNPLIYTNHPPSQAEVLDMMRRFPLFVQEPYAMFQSTISLSDRDEILAKAIPALSGPAGSRAISLSDDDEVNASRNIDMNAVARPNGWPTAGHGDYLGRWLHGDIKNVAFLFNYKVFIDWVGKGDLK